MNRIAAVLIVVSSLLALSLLSGGRSIAPPPEDVPESGVREAALAAEGEPRAERVEDPRSAETRRRRTEESTPGTERPILRGRWPGRGRFAMEAPVHLELRPSAPIPPTGDTPYVPQDGVR